jgi:sec-independent protein translocase protein TatB
VPPERGDVFGIGGPELVVIVLLLLIFVGPEKLPEVMRTVGGGMRDLRRAANLAQAEVKRGLDELSREVDEVTRDVQDAARTVAQDVHGIGRDLQDQVENAADSEGPATQANAAKSPTPAPESDTIEVVRRKSAPAAAPAPAPRLESAPPWSVAGQDTPPELPQPVAIQRPRFNPPGIPQGSLARDSFTAPAPVAEVADAAQPAAAQVAASGSSDQRGLGDLPGADDQPGSPSDAASTAVIDPPSDPSVAST